MNNIVYINDEFITLGQLLKKVGLIDTGGQAKYFLLDNEILINDKKPEGRNSKVFLGDVVWINGSAYFIKSR
ncbi:RNA-binding S4 domain-containing protein [Mycoplasma simbae]|uniref:RNA-binding S4 domain-containing protein n=1 Tax=Mycoplasma simbae TaxID=36744 RepID=UPI0004952F0F|nr:RNA-binding S4 domain-containing protein [Mycoplasma simbae]